MPSGTVTVRSIALVCATSAAAHELRCLALAAHPHGFVALALPGILSAALIALATLVVRVALTSRRRVELAGFMARTIRVARAPLALSGRRPCFGLAARGPPPAFVV